MCKKSGCCCCFLTPKVLFLKSLFGFAGCCASVDGDGAVFFFAGGLVQMLEFMCETKGRNGPP